MMAEPILLVRGFALVPPRTSAAWGDHAARLNRLVGCYGAHQIPIKGLLRNQRAIVDWSLFPDEKRWEVAHALSQNFYPNATPPQVYAKGFDDMLLISTEALTLQTVTPLPDPE